MITAADFGPLLEAALEGQPDEIRDLAACALVGAAAAQLACLIGARAASAILYRLADQAATQHIAPDPSSDRVGRRGGWPG